MQLPCVQSTIADQLTSEWQGRPLQATAIRKLRRCFKLLMQTTGVSLSIRRCSIINLCSSKEVDHMSGVLLQAQWMSRSLWSGSCTVRMARQRKAASSSPFQSEHRHFTLSHQTVTA